MVLQAWDDRLDRAKFIASDVDEEFLRSVPFAGIVKIKGVILIGGEGSCPRQMRIFKNRPEVGFLCGFWWFGAFFNFRWVLLGWVYFFVLGLVANWRKKTYFCSKQHFYTTRAKNLVANGNS